MAHFARLNIDNIVTGVEVVSNDVATTEQLGIDFLKTVHKTNNEFVKTSYNTANGIHKLGGTPFRKNYAGIGYTYDETRDAFIPRKPFASWILNETTCQWKAPISEPDNGFHHAWNEATSSWDQTDPII